MMMSGGTLAAQLATGKNPQALRARIALGLACAAGTRYAPRNKYSSCCGKKNGQEVT
jgi:hypothetical protein